MSLQGCQVQRCPLVWRPQRQLRVGRHQLFAAAGRTTLDIWVPKAQLRSKVSPLKPLLWCAWGTDEGDCMHHIIQQIVRPRRVQSGTNLQHDFKRVLLRVVMSLEMEVKTNL